MYYRLVRDSDRGENYNFSNGQEINHKTLNEAEKHDERRYISKWTCTQVLKVETQPSDINEHTEI